MFENKTTDWSKFTVLTKFKQMDLDTAWVQYFLNSKLGLPDTQVTQTFKNERVLELEYFNDFFSEGVNMTIYFQSKLPSNIWNSIKIF